MNPTGKVIPLPAQGSALYQADEEQKNAVLARRIAWARAQKGYSKRELVRQLALRGVPISYPAVVRWERNESVPNAYQLLAICDALGVPDCYTFFMAGRGELNDAGLKKLSDYRADLIASGNYRPAPAEQPEPVRFVEMKLSTLPVSAGTGDFLDDGNFETVRFPASSVPAGAEFAVRVDGDSMEPVYQDRQIVWVRRCAQLRPGEVGIFAVDGKGYIKAYDEQKPEADEVENYLDSDGVLHSKPVLISYNPKYAPIEVGQADRFVIFGRVLR